MNQFTFTYFIDYEFFEWAVLMITDGAIRDNGKANS